MKYLAVFLCTYVFSSSNFPSPCVDKKKNIDISCKCIETKTCYKGYSKKNKKLLLKKAKSKAEKKLLKIKFSTDQLMARHLSNRPRKGDNEKFEKLNKINKKLDKVLSKKYKKYEQILRKRGVKKWKMKDRVKSIQRIQERSISKSERDRIEKEGLFTRFTRKFKDVFSPDMIKFEKKHKKLSAQLKGKDLIQLEGEVTLVESNKSLPKTENIRAKDVAAQDYNYNSIIDDKETPIFSFISKRYRIVQRRLSISYTPEGGLQDSDKEKLLGSFIKELIKNQ